MVTAKSGANIRTGPGTNYSIVGAVLNGTELVLATPGPHYDSSGCKWYKVVYQGYYRYISGITGYDF